MHKATDIDECLLSYLNSINEATEESHLDHLLNGIARRLLNKVCNAPSNQDQIKDSFGTGRLDIQDAVSEVLLKILATPSSVKADPAGQPISNFKGLVATTAYRTLSDQLRGHHRQRANRDKKTRRFFGANKNSAIWKDEKGELICGYAIWRKKQFRAKAGTSSDLLLLTSELRTSEEELNTAN